ncbi:MAG: M28 family peptidase [Acidobacteriota bacterium]
MHSTARNPTRLFFLSLAMTGALALFGACSPGAETAAEVDLVAAAPQAAEVITEEVLKPPIAYLSDDALQGRGPGSEGDTATRQYLIQQLGAMGYQPGAADGGWEQPFDILGITTTAPETWNFVAGNRSLSLNFWDDFIAGSGVQEAAVAVADAEVVFVGYGIEAPEYGWDDYKGADLTGKVLLMLNNDPDWDPALFEGNRRLYYGRWTYKYESAAAQGAAGAIIIHTTPSAGYPFQVVQTSWTGPQFELPAGDEARVQVAAWVSEDAAERLVSFAGENLAELTERARSREFEPVPLAVTTSIELTNELESTQTANVLAVLPGRDPELADEALVFSAHHDHLGVGKADAEGDTVYNGAFDNASGCSQLLAIARAFRELPEAPRRSLLFAFVAAEEQGLLGSAFFARNPTFPPGKIAANINYDGANIWGRTRDIGFIGYGKSSLDEVVEKYAGEQGRVVKADQFPDRGFFYRSDQFNFAKIGVPAIYFDSGTEFIGQPEGWGEEQIKAWESVQYHQPSDELEDDWNFEGMIEDARLGFRAAVEIAEANRMPTWNPGDEFEAARLAALENASSAEGSE